MEAFSEPDVPPADQQRGEVLERRRPTPPPFDVKALVVDGQLWLTVGKSTRHLRAGDDFELARDIEHSERYGVEGATYWVARRNPKGA
ncbi:MAG: AraC family transcriptional regulator [Ideonella sp.]|nr:AraC family transcriptional regulator [Ideonella sp.]